MSARYCEYLNEQSARRESLADKIAAALCVLAVALLVYLALWVDEGTARVWPIVAHGGAYVCGTDTECEQLYGEE